MHVIRRQLDHLQQPDDLLQQILVCAMNPKRQLQNLFDTPPRIQRRAWILEDNLYRFLEGQWPRLVSLEQVLPLEADATLGWPVHTDGRVSDGALARAGFPDQAKSFSFSYGKGDAIYGLDGDRLPFQDAAVPDDKVLFQIGDGQNVNSHGVYVPFRVFPSCYG